MNLISESPAAILWLLGALLLAGAAEDAARLRISNLISLGILLLAVVAAVLVGLEPGLWENLAVFAALLAFGTWLFSTGKFGGGDVKLLAVTGLWVDLLGSLRLLSAVFIAGGVLAFVILGSRVLASDAAKERIAVLKPRAGIPYGIAIAAGTLITIAVERLR